MPELSAPVQVVKTTRRIISNESGGANLKSLFWMLFFAAAIYSAYLLAPPYVRYYLFRTEVEEEAKLADMYDNETLVKRIFQKAQSWKIPIEKEDIKITRDKEEINVTIYYVVTIGVAGYYQRDLEYNINVTEPVRETSGILH